MWRIVGTLIYLRNPGCAFTGTILHKAPGPASSCLLIATTKRRRRRRRHHVAQRGTPEWMAGAYIKLSTCTRATAATLETEEVWGDTLWMVGWVAKLHYKWFSQPPQQPVVGSTCVTHNIIICASSMLKLFHSMLHNESERDRLTNIMIFGGCVFVPNYLTIIIAHLLCAT